MNARHLKFLLEPYGRDVQIVIVDNDGKKEFVVEGHFDEEKKMFILEVQNTFKGGS